MSSFSKDERIQDGAKSVGIMTLRIMTFSIASLIKMKPSITILNKNETQHNNT